MKNPAIILALTVMGIIACSNDPVETKKSVGEKRAVDAEKIKIDIFAKKACGATEPTIAKVKELIDQMDVSSELNIIMLKSHRQAIELKIPGVPTIRVNGVDIDPAAEQIQKYGITWRKYGGVSEIPPKEMIIKAIESASKETGDRKGG